MLIIKAPSRSSLRVFQLRQEGPPCAVRRQRTSSDLRIVVPPPPRGDIPGTAGAALAAGRFLLNGLKLADPRTVFGGPATKSPTRYGGDRRILQTASLRSSMRTRTCCIVDKPAGMLSHRVRMRETDVLTALESLREGAGYARGNRLRLQHVRPVDRDQAQACGRTSGRRDAREPHPQVLLRRLRVSSPSRRPLPPIFSRMRKARSSARRRAFRRRRGGEAYYRVLYEKGDMSLP
ncbi:MAG: hypothetical protein M0C28_18700 [Candidatus Moduliflexus flocculans]|nr:hypothetical protein [Candidatus Moduliflexus flocculans]